MKRLPVVLLLLVLLCGLGAVGWLVLFAPPGIPPAGTNHAVAANDTPAAPIGNADEPPTNNAQQNQSPADNADGTDRNPAPDNAPPPSETTDQVLSGRVIDESGNGVPLAFVMWWANRIDNDSPEAEQQRTNISRNARWLEDPDRDRQNGMERGATRVQGQVNNLRLITRADAEGRFRLDWTDATAKDVSGPGLLCATSGDFNPAFLPLDTGARGPVDVVLSTRTGVRVVVQDEAGNPVANAQVRIWGTELPLNAPTPDELADSDDAARKADAKDFSAGNADAFGCLRHDTTPGRYYHAVALSNEHRPDRHADHAASRRHAARQGGRPGCRGRAVCPRVDFTHRRQTCRLGSLRLPEPRHRRCRRRVRGTGHRSERK